MNGSFQACGDDQRVCVGYNNFKGFADLLFADRPEGDRYLPDEGVVDLEENVYVREGGGYPIVCCVDDDSDGGLRDPGEGLRKEIVYAVEVSTDKAKGVADRASGQEGILHGFVPLCNSWMLTEPLILEVLRLGDGEVEGGGERPSLSAVVGEVNASFGAGVVGLVLAFLASLLDPEHVYGVGTVDFGATASLVIPESLLKDLVVSFPRYDLGIGASKVDVEEDVARVRKEETPYIWQRDFRTEFHL